MGRLKNKVDYENLRNSRILENQARLASLGLHKTISDLRSLVSLAKSEKTHKRKDTKREREPAILRRSDRLKRVAIDSSVSHDQENTGLRRSDRLRSRKPTASFQVGKVDIHDDSADDESADDESGEEGSEEDERSQNAPSVKGTEPQHSPEASPRSCLFGICCHFCRGKKLCGNEDCKHCANIVPGQPCIGRTECSICGSSEVVCGACFEVRYGEDTTDEVRKNKEWMCHCCIEKGRTDPLPDL